MALNYSSKHDISYANYNNKNIPWKLNASIISQNNQIINPSLNLGAINNNLVIESSQNDILFFTSQNENKKVIVKNNMAINNLDVSNNLKTKLIDASSISLNNILYFPSLPINIIGDLKVYGVINVIGSSRTGLARSKTQFINSILRASKFTDVSIVECDISDSSFNNVNIINSYINAIPNGYGFDKSNNSYPNKANFSDVSLQHLVLDSSLNSYINFAANASNSISIRSYDDYSKLVISKPLTVGIGETISNISNVSIFYGTISCNTLYYSQLVPDIRLNNYFDVSIGLVSVSGNNIPVNNSFNIGSSNYKFNEIISTQFSGDLSGTATIANDLIKNLDMSFNNLDIYGTFTLNRQNLNQFLSGDLISIIAADISFINANTKVRDLSASLYSKTGFDLCLNSNFTKISLRDTSFDALNNEITSISASVYSRTGFDLCLNSNFTKISLRDTSFDALNNKITSISASVYSKTGFDLCLNSNFAKISLRDTSFDALNDKITSISASVYSKSDFDLCLNRNLLRINDVSAIVAVVTHPARIYPRLGYIDSSLNKVTNAKVSNELVFPYAITYVDDAYEDNILKEDYSYQINVPGVTTRSFELNTTNYTWDEHRLNAITVPGRNLASILSITENNTIVNLRNAWNSTAHLWIGGRRKVFDNTEDGGALTWEWVNGDQWNYTNWNSGQPDVNDYYVNLLSFDDKWHDDGRDIYNTTRLPAAYVTVVNTSRTDSYNETKPKLPIIVASSNGSVVATGTSVQSGPNNAINNTASNAGYLKISENNINNSYYRTINTQTLHADTCSLAMSNDGMFIAYIQGSSAGYPVLKVNMRNSDGWGQQLGTTILLTDSLNNYQTMASGIIPTIFGDDWKKNLKNLAINYISGENPPRIFLAFGSARSKVSIYSYDNANWIFSNGFYSVTGGSWVLKHTHLASTLGASTNFGYFVVLSHNPRILVFTIDDKFYSYNCSDSSFAARGSNEFIRLPTGVTNFTNIIALKITSDADKIIVSNTHYVYIYKWNNASWTSIRVLDFNVTFNYGSTNNIPAGPRSLDISNINSNNNDCVFAIGFPDKLINSRANNRSRGYVEYYQCLTSSPSAIITKLATLVPRKRAINNNNVDTNEYFFSAGGIKITNANTILVSPNFKFHFNNTTKNYEYNSSTQSWTDHNTNAISVTGRTMASIENEVENELVRITGRAITNFYIGGIGAATQTGNRRGSLNWRWSNNDIFNYENWESYDNLVLKAGDRPYAVANHWIEFYGPLGTWSNLSSNRAAMYMSRSLSYSLNTFSIFDKFYFHSSGFTSSYANTDISSTVIAKWVRTDSPSTQPIEFRGNGDLKRTSQGIFTVSDIRLKENIVDTTPKLEDLLKVRVVNYNLKGCKDAKLIGVVAQELEKLFPTLVKDGELSMHDIYLGKTESYKSVKYSCFDVMLIKAFQEQMAIINKLSSQLDEIDSKTKLLKTISQDCVILKQELDLLKSENELFKLTINEILKLI